MPSNPLLHMGRTQLLTLALLAALWCCHSPSPVAANSLFIPIKVVDCNGVSGISGAQVAMWGCVDDQSIERPRGAAIRPQQGVVRLTDGYGNVATGLTDSPVAPANCPNSYQAEFGFGSASSSCKFAVIDSDGSIDNRFTTAELFPSGLKLWAVQNIIVCADNTTLPLGAPLEEKATTANCSTTVACYSAPTEVRNGGVLTLQKKVCGCPKADCPTAPSGGFVSAVSETAFGFICPAFNKSILATGQSIDTSFPVSFSFTAGQKLGVSDPVYDLKSNRWGWMIRWPTTYTCPLTGILYGGQYKAAGEVSAKVSYSEATRAYTLTYSYTMKAGNAISEVHIYFSCTQLTTSAPGNFGNNPTVIVKGYPYFNGTATASTSCAPPAEGSYLYISFHAVVGSTSSRKMRMLQ